MLVVLPCLELAVSAAILGALAPSALGKLSRELFPFATLEMGALSNATLGFILSARVSHDDTGPVLDLVGVLSDSELLHNGENVDSLSKVLGADILLGLKVVVIVGLLPVDRALLSASLTSHSLVGGNDFSLLLGSVLIQELFVSNTANVDSIVHADALSLVVINIIVLNDFHDGVAFVRAKLGTHNGLGDSSNKRRLGLVSQRKVWHKVAGLDALLGA